MGRVFKHNFTYADEAGRNVSLTYEAEHGEHVRIVPLDDEAGGAPPWEGPHVPEPGAGLDKSSASLQKWPTPP